LKPREGASDFMGHLFYFTMTLLLVACGNNFDPTSPSTPHPINIVPANTLESPVKNLGIAPSLAAGTDNFLRVSYYDHSFFDENNVLQFSRNLKFARCTDAACASSTLTTVDTTGDVGMNSSLAMAPDGFARISYYDASNGDLKFARCTDADCTAPTLTALDSTGDVGSSASLVIGSDGFARISYYDASNGMLKFARCTNADCTAAILTVIAAISGVGGAHSDIVLGADGFARISYWNLSSLNLEYVRCTNADCSTRTQTTIDTSGTHTLGAGSSIVLGSDGFPRISYLGEESVLAQNGVSSVKGQIKYALCTNADCSNPTIAIVDSSTRFGQITSLSIAADGEARIVYYDKEKGVLKFSRCVNAACSSPVTNTADATANTGDFPSLLIGTDGFAKIAYFYHTNGDLKLAQCTNADCTSNNIITIDR